MTSDLRATLAALLAGRADPEQVVKWAEELTALAARASAAAATASDEAPALVLELREALAPLAQAPAMVRDLLDLINHRSRSEASRLAAAERVLTALRLSPSLKRIGALLDALATLHEPGIYEPLPVAQRFGIASSRFQRRLRDEVQAKNRERGALPPADLASAAPAVEAVERLALLLAATSPRERRLLALVLEGRTVQEAARELRITPAAARKLLTRLRRRCG